MSLTGHEEAPCQLGSICSRLGLSEPVVAQIGRREAQPTYMQVTFTGNGRNLTEPPRGFQSVRAYGSLQD